jgi:hypothetical protein
LEPATTSYYFENFDRENVPYWDVDHKPFYWTEKKDGALFVNLNQDNTMAQMFPLAFELTDGMMTAWAEVIDARGEVFYGVACRANSSPLAYYGFWISTMGRYQAELVQPGSYEVLAGGTSDAIHQGTAQNGIQIYCRDGRMIFYANGQVLVDLKNDDLSGGSFGLLAGTGQGTSVGVVKFDHIDISYPSGN